MAPLDEAKDPLVTGFHVHFVPFSNSVSASKCTAWR
jgi:hypothetical protein